MSLPKRNSSRKSKKPIVKEYLHQEFFPFARENKRNTRLLEILQQHQLPMTSYRFYPQFLRVRLPNANVRATFIRLTGIFEKLGLEKRNHLILPKQESDMISREGLDFPERAVAKKYGKIRSAFFYYFGKELVCSVHRASLRAGPKGSTRARDEVWIDIRGGPYGEFLAKSLFRRTVKKKQ